VEDMPGYYLATDIGASGGGHYVGCLNDGRLSIEKIHRFANGTMYDGSHLVWDVEVMAAAGIPRRPTRSARALC
jgi:hypothetical protein